MSRSLMSEGQCLSSLFQGMFKFEDNPFKNDKVITTYSKRQVKFRHWTLRSRSFMDEGQG
jgi:hypothetical protein